MFFRKKIIKYINRKIESHKYFKVKKSHKL